MLSVVAKEYFFHLEPLCVLVEHGVHNMDEGLITGEESMTAGEQITFEPALAHMLTQHFHHAAVPRKVLVRRKHWLHEHFVSDFVQSIEPVRGRFIRTEYPKVLRVCVSFHDIAQKIS